MRDKLTLVKSYVGTAEMHLEKANRTYAYYKNNFNDKAQYYYVQSQQAYKKAREIAQKDLDTMRSNNISDSGLESRIHAILSKCDSST